MTIQELIDNLVELGCEYGNDSEVLISGYIGCAREILKVGPRRVRFSRQMDLFLVLDDVAPDPSIDKIVIS